jgi:hypothetical protein
MKSLFLQRFASSRAQVLRTLVRASPAAARILSCGQARNHAQGFAREHGPSNADEIRQ